jgi:putative IMPACT (imprinted ancient) family translation regulator
VVIRYFGGTLLGVSGLINAYRSAAANAIDHAKIIQRTVMDMYEISFEYNAMNDVMRLMKDHGLQQINQQFDLDCRLSFAVRKNDAVSIYEKMRKIEGLQIKFIQTL